MSGNNLLLIRRAQPPEKGLWSLPGGRVEAGESLRQAVEREVLEEAGIEVSCGEFVGWVERISSRHHFVIMDFRASPVSPKATLQPADDADDAKWVPIQNVAEFDLVRGLEAFLTEHGVI